MRAFMVLPLLAACTTPSTDVVGPFEGTVQRYAIDRFELPKNSTAARAMGDDLDGDGYIDNAIGQSIGALGSYADQPAHPQDLEVTGFLQSTLEIQTTSLSNADQVGVAYVGRQGDIPVAVGGRFTNGTFASNRSTQSEHLAATGVVLPIFVDADPSRFAVVRGEIDLEPDGAGGFNGTLRGLVDPKLALGEAARGLVQMAMSNPADHPVIGRLFDTVPYDGKLTTAELESNSLISSLLAPDVTIDGAKWVSIGFGFHASPCAAGSCAPAEIVDSCHDRVRDGDETDVDCGGATCEACGFDAACSTGADCQSGACDSGTCREPTCSDGRQDGFEKGVDCGTQQCGLCPGDPCSAASDCKSGSCRYYDTNAYCD